MKEGDEPFKNHLRRGGERRRRTKGKKKMKENKIKMRGMV